MAISNLKLQTPGRDREARLYINGRFCDSTSIPQGEPPSEIDTGRPKEVLTVIGENHGKTLMDELKLYNAFPDDDDIMMDIYKQEKGDN